MEKLKRRKHHRNTSRGDQQVYLYQLITFRTASDRRDNIKMADPKQMWENLQKNMQRVQQQGKRYRHHMGSSFFWSGC